MVYGPKPDTRRVSGRRNEKAPSAPTEIPRKNVTLKLP